MPAVESQESVPAVDSQESVLVNRKRRKLDKLSESEGSPSSRYINQRLKRVAKEIHFPSFKNSIKIISKESITILS